MVHFAATIIIFGHAVPSPVADVQVWAAFPAHVKQQGLTFDGLQQLYAEVRGAAHKLPALRGCPVFLLIPHASSCTYMQGLGDPEHDYQLLVQQAADETAAATAAAAVQLEGSATKGQRMETEGVSNLPALPAKIDRAFAGLSHNME